MYELLRASKPYMETVAAKFDMTPQQVFAMRQLSNDSPLPMSALATMLGCDASNVTSIVDKLETRGFLERRSVGHDRRVKALFMTPAGVDVRRRIDERMLVPPPAIANLSPGDQHELCEILGRAVDSVEAALRAGDDRGVMRRVDVSAADHDAHARSAEPNVA